MRYELDELIDFAAALLERKGLAPDRARRIAAAQVEVEAFGVTTHGVHVLAALLGELGGKVDADRRPQSLRDAGALAAFDGARCIGVECLLTACDQARERAREHGIALVSMLHAGWVGALGYHLAALARDGFLAMAWAQMSGWPCVAPFGGREGRLSTNPMAFSFPSDPDPVVADFSTAAVSSGKVWAWCRNGARPPEPLLLDSAGAPTDDPNVLKDGGTILPFGGRHYGFRGTALAMWIEALTAAAGGEPANARKEGGQNVHVLAVHIGALHGAASYPTAMQELMDYVLSSAPAQGSTGPAMPGQREWAALARAREEGVDLDEGKVEKLREAAKTLGVTMPHPIGD